MRKSKDQCPPHHFFRSLILHADDLGLSRSVNEVTFAALKDGTVSSASTMVTCAHFPEVAEFASHNPEFDIGIHITLTSEWNFARWGPIASLETVPSLVDGTGNFFHTVASLTRQACLDHIEIEVRAQIEFALESGVKPTHLDSHMSALFATPALYGLLRRIASDYGLALPQLHVGDELAGTIPTLDRIYQISEAMSHRNRIAEYQRIIDCLPEGTSVLLVHLGKDEEELRRITDQQRAWGARWRALDAYALSSNVFRRTLTANNIALCRWSDLPASFVKDHMRQGRSATTLMHRGVVPPL